MATRNRVDKIEILDDLFQKIEGPVDSGNLRVTFKSGASLDVYLDSGLLRIVGNGHVYEPVLMGVGDGGFSVAMQKANR